MDTNKDSNNEIKDDDKIIKVKYIVDPIKLASQDKITYSDVILTILEICTFNKRYNYYCSNTTSEFWKRVIENDNLKKIFKDYKSETLRKYWREIRKSDNLKKYLEIVNDNISLINFCTTNLFNTINIITEYILSSANNAKFDEYFYEIIKKKNIDKKSKPLKTKKRKKQIKPKNINKKNKSKDKEDKLKVIDDVVTKLIEITNQSYENVLEALIGCNADLKKTYLFLKNKEKYSNYFFDKNDDYIIKNLKKTKYYKELIDIKGEEEVKERYNFLKKTKRK